MRLVVIGTRGVPASYSGFETCVESVGRRLVERGHRVVVYCRRGRTGGSQKSYLGMDLVTLPAVRTKGLETLSHSFLSTIHARLKVRPDAALVFGVGNAVFCRQLRWSGVPSVINVDGADWARRKWGLLGRRYLLWSERVATRAADAIIADSQTVAGYYRQAYGAETTYIPYGADIPDGLGTGTLDHFGLSSRGYLLAVGRMVPENGFHHMIAAYRSVAPRLPLVIVGDAPYSDHYKRQLRDMAPPGVIFTGYQFGQAYHELSANAYAFLFAAEVGGTHPVLVEQLAHGNCVLARWTESNAEVLDGAGLFFRDEAELPAKLDLLVRDPDLVNATRGQARQQSRRYSWDEIAGQYEGLLARVARA